MCFFIFRGLQDKLYAIEIGIFDLKSPCKLMCDDYFFRNSNFNRFRLNSGDFSSNWGWLCNELVISIFRRPKKLYWTGLGIIALKMSEIDFVVKLMISRFFIIILCYFFYHRNIFYLLLQSTDLALKWTVHPGIACIMNLTYLNTPGIRRYLILSYCSAQVHKHQIGQDNYFLGGTVNKRRADSHFFCCCSKSLLMAFGMFFYFNAFSYVWLEKNQKSFVVCIILFQIRGK